MPPNRMSGMKRPDNTNSTDGTSTTTSKDNMNTDGTNTKTSKDNTITTNTKTMNTTNTNTTTANTKTTNTKTRKLCLLIIDGWGHSPIKKGNAIASTPTPWMTRLTRTHPSFLLTASGTAVGLPENQMGNSMVGHLTIGAGRVVPQPQTRIDGIVREGGICACLTAAGVVGVRPSSVDGEGTDKADSKTGGKTDNETGMVTETGMSDGHVAYRADVTSQTAVRMTAMSYKQASDDNRNEDRVSDSRDEDRASGDRDKECASADRASADQASADQASANRVNAPPTTAVNNKQASADINQPPRASPSRPMPPHTRQPQSTTRSQPRRLQLVGLLSDGGIHSHISHLFAILDAVKNDYAEIYVHCITDGRDTAPQSAVSYVEALEQKIREIGRAGNASDSAAGNAVDNKTTDKTSNTMRTHNSHNNNKTGNETGNETTRTHDNTTRTRTHDNTTRTHNNTTRTRKRTHDNARIRIASVAGRWYTMDRDNNTDRIAEAYAMMTHGKKTDGPIAAYIRTFYERDMFDEHIRPALFEEEGTVRENDVLLFFNYRADRMKQIVRRFVDARATTSRMSGGHAHDRSSRAHDESSDRAHDRSSRAHDVPDDRTRDVPNDHAHSASNEIYTLTNYDDTLNTTTIVPTPPVPNTLAATISTAGLSQSHIAETEKYAHVTYFLNGGRERPFPAESRVLVPSPKVRSYDLRPAMSIRHVVAACLAQCAKGDDFVVANFANPDMVGHTGSFEATCEAVGHTDEAVGVVYEGCGRMGYGLVVTADHGNAEMMEEDGRVVTKHTDAKVPLILCGMCDDVNDVSDVVGRGVCDDVVGRGVRDDVVGRGVRDDVVGRGVRDDVVGRGVCDDVVGRDDCNSAVRDGVRDDCNSAVVGRDGVRDDCNSDDVIREEAYDGYGTLADVAPTVLEFLGLPKPVEMTGRSLLPRRKDALRRGHGESK